MRARPQGLGRRQGRSSLAEKERGNNGGNLRGHGIDKTCLPDSEESK